MDNFIEQGLDIFIEECFELLQEMESSLNALREDTSDEEMINSVFRAAHTIKGSAGLFGLDSIINFTHKVENILSSVRSGTVTLSTALIDQLMHCKDHIEILVEQIGQDDPDESITIQSEIIIAELEKLSCGEAPVNPIVSAPTDIDVSNPNPVEKVHHSLVATQFWHISLRFDKDVLRNGMDPLSLLQYLTNLGEILDVITLTETIPSADEMDAETCYIGLEINFDSNAERQEIIDVFQFISDDSLVWVLPPQSKISQYSELIAELKENDASDRIGQILVDTQILSARELEQALELQQQSEENKAKPLGEILVDQKAMHPQNVNQVLKKQQQAKDNQLRESKYIRVDSELLDSLVNIVGELVIASEGSSMLADQFKNSQLIESTSVVTRLVEEIRDRTLNLRMVQVGDTFKRFNRIVREISSELDKNIKLNISGAETELDKSVVEKIGDPLTHLIRNSIDHGIETAEHRLAANKPAQGLVSLNAFHDSGYIIIQVSDDGRGIDADKLLAKAIEKGLVSENDKLSRQEVLQLIMHPGLSTKEQVSSLSGRGVGMDVVKRNVESLRGSIDIESQLGQGTVISLRMPLTLSIISGLLVGVGACRYVIPLDSVIECIELPQNTHRNEYDGNFINLRGQALPYIDMSHQFVKGQSTSKRKNIVVVKHGDKQAGLVVDTLLGENQTVIKPLNKIFANLTGFSGSTILGDGDVALIFDIPGLISQVNKGITCLN